MALCVRSTAWTVLCMLFIFCMDDNYINLRNPIDFGGHRSKNGRLASVWKFIICTIIQGSPMALCVRSTTWMLLCMLFIFCRMISILILRTLLILEVTAQKMANWRAFENWSFTIIQGLRWHIVCALQPECFHVSFLFFACMISISILGTLLIFGVAAQK